MYVASYVNIVIHYMNNISLLSPKLLCKQNKMLLLSLVALAIAYARILVYVFKIECIVI